ncbi:hypothetical protein NE237_002429 [Protea cynaroides]|uniref:Uncharacterized protein n=1 Tax=Protea cynaroides TaxID=273540 RepID=A0A9Q0QZ20_9MAGN|nr:hypothetical protein NE237_002429 [Protea cynaroides]
MLSLRLSARGIHSCGGASSPSRRVSGDLLAFRLESQYNAVHYKTGKTTLSIKSAFSVAKVSTSIEPEPVGEPSPSQEFNPPSSTKELAVPAIDIVEDEDEDQATVLKTVSVEQEIDYPRGSEDTLAQGHFTRYPPEDPCRALTTTVYLHAR